MNPVTIMFILKEELFVSELVKAFPKALYWVRYR